MHISPNDLKPVHKAAKAAMSLFAEQYGPQSSGINDFYDQLPQADKNRCRRLVTGIRKAPPEPKR